MEVPAATNSPRPFSALPQETLARDLLLQQVCGPRILTPGHRLSGCPAGCMAQPSGELQQDVGAGGGAPRSRRGEVHPEACAFLQADGLAVPPGLPGGPVGLGGSVPPALWVVFQ